MKLRRIIAGISAVVMSLSALSFSAFSTVSAETADTVFDDMNQQQIIEAMEPGWNLGNQLEAVSGTTPNETAWGNPVITQKTFKMVKDAGFKSVRIPVSYFSKIGNAPDYTIDDAWLTRIKEVVDMALAEGLYAIINMHGDGYNSMAGGWLLCNAPESEQPAIKAKYESCWRQIANTFKSYDEHLIFESMNEEFDGTYATPNRTYYGNINAYNQIFVDTVRQTGKEEGNNAKRWLLVPGWNTDIEYTVGDYGFAIPTDTYRDASIPADEQRIMISVHFYAPWDFCGDGGSSKTTWGTDAEVRSLQDQLTRCYTSFIMKGYPVVIGECGVINKANESSRIKWVSELCKTARSRRLIPVFWDNNGHGTGADKFGLFDRSTFEVTQQGIIDSIMAAYEGDPEPFEVITPITKDQALGVIYSDNNPTTLVTGSADASMAGAVKVRYVFDCASDVAFNAYTEINMQATIAGTQSFACVTGYSDVTGATMCTGVMELTKPIKAGDNYTFTAYTQSWKNNAKDYVFLIRCIEFLDANGNVIKTIDKSNKPAPTTAKKPTTTAPKTTTPTKITKPAKVTKVKVVAKKKKLKVSWKKVKGACGYEVMYAKNKKFTKGKKTVYVKKAKVTLKKLKSKKKYFVKVRAYKNVTTSGTKCVSKHYGKWSAVVKKKTK